ncbi:MAG: transposase [Treponema sp.]|nr:transposase [Treponema sp.]
MLDQIDFHGITEEELAGENGLLKKLTSRFYSKALNAEIDEHLVYKKNDNAGDNSSNSRNGYTTKTVTFTTARSEPFFVLSVLCDCHPRKLPRDYFLNLCTLRLSYHGLLPA